MIHEVLHCGGLIPAGAGSTAGYAYRRHGSWAHPRWRGEHNRNVRSATLMAGSSPLARGAQVIFGAHGRWLRLIPAGAGSTTSIRSPARCSRAHPRWRGEHLGAGRCWTLRRGSSPLARGARALQASRTPVARLIPAGAGSTQSGPCSASTDWAHPRWRGEHCRRSSVTAALIGLIPAGAGSTRNAARAYAASGAHPRWRGEHCPLFPR